MKKSIFSHFLLHVSWTENWIKHVKISIRSDFWMHQQIFHEILTPSPSLDVKSRFLYFEHTWEYDASWMSTRKGPKSSRRLPKNFWTQRVLRTMYHNNEKNLNQISKQRKFRIWRRKVIILEGFGLKISIFAKFKKKVLAITENRRRAEFTT